MKFGMITKIGMISVLATSIGHSYAGESEIAQLFGCYLGVAKVSSGKGAKIDFYLPKILVLPIPEGKGRGFFLFHENGASFHDLSQYALVKSKMKLHLNVIPPRLQVSMKDHDEHQMTHFYSDLTYIPSSQSIDFGHPEDDFSTYTYSTMDGRKVTLRPDDYTESVGEDLESSKYAEVGQEVLQREVLARVTSVVENFKKNVLARATQMWTSEIDQAQKISKEGLTICQQLKGSSGMDKISKKATQELKELEPVVHDAMYASQRKVNDYGQY